MWTELSVWGLRCPQLGSALSLVVDRAAAVPAGDSLVSVLGCECRKVEETFSHSGGFFQIRAWGRAERWWCRGVLCKEPL